MPSNRCLSLFPEEPIVVANTSWQYGKIVRVELILLNYWGCNPLNMLVSTHRTSRKSRLLIYPWDNIIGPKDNAVVLRKEIPPRGRYGIPECYLIRLRAAVQGLAWLCCNSPKTAVLPPCGSDRSSTEQRDHRL